MPPLIPYHVSAGSNPISVFGGALVTEFLEPPPGRCFCFRQTYKLKPPTSGNSAENEAIRAALLKPSGPPAHFHPFQNEYFRVVSGRMAIEIDGKQTVQTPEDGEVVGRAGSIHRFWISPDSTEDMVIILSASDNGMDYQLDRVFFENWYGIWHDYLVHERKFDLIQLLCTYDAGDAYLVPPAFLPKSVRVFVGYWGGIIVGRWIGGLLGYKPFFKEYTTDWDYAVAKMQYSFFTRNSVATSYKRAKSWAELQPFAKSWLNNGDGTAKFLDNVSNGQANGETHANGQINGKTHANGTVDIKEVATP